MPGPEIILIAALAGKNRVIGNRGEPGCTAFVIGKFTAKQIFDALGRVLERILVKKSFTHVGLGGLVDLPVQRVSICLVLIIAQGGRHLHKLKYPVVVRRERHGAARGD